MRSHVDLHSSRYATVHFTPSLVDRLLLRRSYERGAELVGGRWCWIGGGWVGAIVERALVEAYRDQIVARATAPP